MAEDNKKVTDDILKAMEQFLTTKSVVGEPMYVGDTVILPMADVSFGMGIGSFSKGDNGTGGLGGKVTPTAIVIIKDGNTKIVNIKDQDSFQKIMDFVPEVVDKFKNRNKSDDSDEMDLDEMLNDE